MKRPRKHTHNCGRTGHTLTASCHLTCGCWCHKVTRWTVERRARQLLEGWLRGINQRGKYASLAAIVEAYKTALSDARREFRTMPHFHGKVDTKQTLR